MRQLLNRMMRFGSDIDYPKEDAPSIAPPWFDSSTIRRTLKLPLRLWTEDHSQQGPSTDLFIFSQQSLNYLLGLIVGAFTNVHPANAAGFVQDKDRWPGVDVISAPQFEPVVRDHGILNRQRSDFTAHAVEIPLASGLR